MPSLRRHEGYLLIDNTNSPGVPDTLPRPNNGAPVITGKPGQKTEIPFYTCSHCQTPVVVNPGRTRDREHCRKCHRIICDNCALEQKLGKGPHNPMARKFEEEFKRLASGLWLPL